MNIASDGRERYPGVIFVSSTLYNLYQTGAKWDEDNFKQIEVGNQFRGWATIEEALQLQELETIEAQIAYLDVINFFGITPEDFEIWINSLHWFG